MLPYLIFPLLAAGAVARPLSRNASYFSIAAVVAMYGVVMAIRQDVGVDWQEYVRWFQIMEQHPFTRENVERGYFYLNVYLRRMGGEVSAVFFWLLRLPCLVQRS
ncbi:hypothetical protein CAI21_06430 [Alkalilimnicola ehrlichii]|uniref:Uncharacterized protein n=1 Tax=Alkalilimnicola ehrlichii TaxID=351052 RepID=A0A3E0WZM0_9GAMM|nr:hypothetical protein CAI21_06430 [Alkalilimnicola ehrlichii]RFA37829.1 hypothetical protein CAL65_07780 [Alkalilimnicola ehrlichii]